MEGEVAKRGKKTNEFVKRGENRGAAPTGKECGS